MRFFFIWINARLFLLERQTAAYLYLYNFRLKLFFSGPVNEQFLSFSLIALVTFTL